MRKVLKEDFFNRDTKIVAQELLGKFLVQKINGREISAMIKETEAYDGPYDKASHASKGRTKRTEIMFGKPGNFYVYLCYGMHYMLNVVTREQGYPAAVLIRGAKLQGADLDGPGKITKLFGINKNFNGKVASKSNNLWFEDRPVRQSLGVGGGVVIPKSRIKKLSRVGVNYAGPMWSSKKLRFVI